MAGEQRVTLKQIATDCGVSVMTVSRVLRNQRYVKPALREKIQETAKRLGYRPDPALDALIRYRNKSRHIKATGEKVVLITPEEPVHGWGVFQILIELQSDIKNEAHRLGYQFQSLSRPEDGALLPATLKVLYNQGVRGIILAPSINISGVPLKTWEEFAVLTLEPGIHNVPFHAVRNDFFQMCECAIEAFHAKGHKRIAYVAGPIDARSHFRALGGLIACRERHQSLTCEYFKASRWGNKAPANYYSWVSKFRPEAIIATSTWPLKWHQAWQKADKPPIEFAQLNRPRSDNSINGVCTPTKVHGSQVIQRLHHFLIENEKGIPDSRTVLRVDGHWREADPKQYL